MRQNVPWTLEGLDPDTREAARDAARRSGMSVDDWVASTISERAGRSYAEPPARAYAEPAPRGGFADQAARAYVEAPPPRRRAPAPDDLETVAAKLTKVTRQRQPATRDLDAVLSVAALESERRNRDNVQKTAVALDSVARWIERAEDRLAETSRAAQDLSRAAQERQERTTAVVGEAMELMTRRLDDIERKAVEGQQPSILAALKAVERIESQLARSSAEKESGQAAQIEAALRGFEGRIAAISERLSQQPARAFPRRGRDPREEVLGAVAEIRARQEELAAEPRRRAEGAPALPRSHSDILLSLKGDIAKLAGQLDTVRAEPDQAGVGALRQDLDDLRRLVGGLATRDEIGALERAVRVLTADVTEARVSGGDLASVAAPMTELQEEVRRLSETVATGLHGRLAGEIETIAHKVDRAADSGVDPAMVEALSQQIGELRRTLSELAEPQRVERLTAQMAELAAQMAQLGRAQMDSAQVDRDEFASLRSAVEDIRGSLKAPAAKGTDFGPKLDRLSAKLDALVDEPQAVSREIERLSNRMDSALAAAGNPAGLEPLINRLDRLSDNLSRVEPTTELKSIEDMLRSLADRLDQADRPGAGHEALDGLERQVAALASRLERAPTGDAGLASLERSMGDLMAQVETLRDGSLAMAERAAKTVVASTLDRLPATGAGEVSTLQRDLQRDLAELKAQYSAADKRTHDTLSAVHATLERVVSRLGHLEDEERPAVPKPAAAKPAEPRSRAAAAAPAGRLEGALKQLQAAARAADADAAALDADRPVQPRSAPAQDEVLLEPGADRPLRTSRAEARAETPPAEADVKASFIAAARRAAQAAAAEAAPPKPRPGRLPGIELFATGEAGPAGLAQKLKGAIDRRRRPLLMGLAAIVLMLGAIQVAGGLIGSKKEAAVKDALAAAPPAVTAPANPPSARSPETPSTAGAVREPAEPQATQSLPSRPRESAEPAAPKLPTLLSDRPDPKVMPALDLPKPGAATALPQPVTTGALPAERVPNMAAVEIPASVGPAGLRQAAAAGDPSAVYELASRAADGRGMTRDPKLAAKLFEKAAAFGLVPAQYRVASHYEKGLGVTKDLALARAWYQRAAEKGNARAMHNLAVMLAQGGDAKPDYATAVEWFRRAAEHGMRDSQFNLAVLLARGLGSGQDVAQSYTWFAIAAGQGDEDAAKKRDEVGARLGAPDLAAAKAAAERWRPEAPSKAANDVDIPPGAWGDQPVRRAGAGDRKV